MSFQVDRIDHVEVFVRDIDEAARWYERVLGLRMIHRWEPDPAFLGAGGTCLALFLCSDKEAVSRTLEEPVGGSPGWWRVAWRTDERGFEAAQRHLKECGVSFRGPIDHEIAFSIYFADPDGNPLEITWYPGG